MSANPKKLFELKIGLPQSTDETLQPSVDSATQKLYDEVYRSVVKLDADAKHHGSGFCVNDSGLVATDAHVVLGAAKFRAINSERKKFSGKLVAMDDIDDLALVQLDGANANDCKAVRLGSSKDVTPDQPLWGVGHPDGADPIYVHPGYYQRDRSMIEIVGGDTDSGKDDLDTKLAKMTPLEKSDADKFLARTLMGVKMNVIPGDSGGPAFDSQGRVVGIMDYSNKESDADLTRVEQLVDLLHAKSAKFKFVNTKTKDGWLLTDVSRVDGAVRPPFQDSITGP